MPIKVLMPALSPTMEEGTLSRWLKSEGDPVSAGDVIAEIETDKATMEVEAVDEGVLGRILVSEGTEGVKVNAVIALLLEEGEDKSALEGAGEAAPPAGAKKDNGAEKDSAKEKKAEEEPDEAPKAARSGNGAVEPAPAGDEGAKAPPAPVRDDGERVAASPLARRMARQAGLDLTQISGTGPHGRIVKQDIEAALRKGKPAPAPAAAGLETGERQPPTEVALTGVQKVIAKRLAEADRDVPQFYLTADIEIDRLLAARGDINAAAGGEYKVSVNDMLIKAAALTLRRHPKANAQWGDDRILQMNTVDIAVAVATERGLITPIVFDADRKGIARISADMRDLAGRAKDGKLKPEEYQGGGFSISNLGMFGMKQFTSIINPPGASILAVGAGEPRPVVRDGELAVATVMTVTLTCDHRIIDGALGAAWVKTFKMLVENPAAMLA